MVNTIKIILILVKSREGSIATADGTESGTKKSELLPIIKDKMINENITTIPDTNKVSAYILDFMAFLRTITDIDIVADMYRPVSSKMQERDDWGSSNCIIINSVKSRTPCDFKEFLSNGENKPKLITYFWILCDRKGKSSK